MSDQVYDIGGKQYVQVHGQFVPLEDLAAPPAAQAPVAADDAAPPVGDPATPASDDASPAVVAAPEGAAVVDEQAPEVPPPFVWTGDPRAVKVCQRLGLALTRNNIDNLSNAVGEFYFPADGA